MIRQIACILSLCLLAACGEKAGDAEIVSPTAQTLPQPAQWASAPEIGVISAPNTDAYCIFFPEGHTFTYDDPDTWRFVFLTHFGDDLPTDSLDGEIMLDGLSRTVELISSKATDTGEIRSYRTKDAPAAAIEVEMIEGEKGMESTAYTGEIRVTQPEGVAPVRFWGDCGV